jgi:hypothetical protein
MRYAITILLAGLAFLSLNAQEVPVIDYELSEKGVAELTFEGEADFYYVLYVRHSVADDNYHPVSMDMGSDSNMTLTEALGSYPAEHYKIEKYSIATPIDHDEDGVDDVSEFLSPISHAPFNPSLEIDYIDGVVQIPDTATFRSLTFRRSIDVIDQRLSDLEVVKFYILDADSDHPRVYFLNGNTHVNHFTFADTIGIPDEPGNSGREFGQLRGQVIYHPNIESNNGELGVYRFRFQPFDSYPFSDVQLVQELLGVNMPFFKNNLCYYPLNDAIDLVEEERELYDNSRVCVLYENDLYFDLDYIDYNQEESFGLLSLYQSGSIPHERDVVIMESLPNELSRVAGIISTVTQTPLAHVNLRAIQDQVPNAFIRDASDMQEVKDLIGKYVYYKVEPNSYILREATIDEVEAYYESLRPIEEQIPVRDLSETNILPLNEIEFSDSKSFGSKCANLATLHTLGFVENTIPEGFGVPFYYYDSFMKYNNFYEEIQDIINQPEFQSDFDFQEDALSDFRKTIKDADMPQWMLDDLDDMHKSFPEGTAVRCRSSTNNEDLPGYSGAGLYDSKTQHLDEGHISKSIKQVFASLWNFRAFAEREFYRIDHFTTAMGVLCHPNFEEELVNGVGVSIDPFHSTDESLYFNNQVGENLVTNPVSLSNPEEILINRFNPFEYLLIRSSSEVPSGELVLDPIYFDTISQYLITIEDRFRPLYNAEGQSDFAMEIEYKITKDNKLAIKQARPWSGYWSSLISSTSDIESEEENLVSIYPNPSDGQATIRFVLSSSDDVDLTIYNSIGQIVYSYVYDGLSQGNHDISLPNSQLDVGTYYCRLSSVGINEIGYVLLPFIVQR